MVQHFKRHLSFPSTHRLKCLLFIIPIIILQTLLETLAKGIMGDIIWNVILSDVLENVSFCE